MISPSFLLQGTHRYSLRVAISIAICMYTQHIAGPCKAKPEDAPYSPISEREKVMLGGELMTANDALNLMVRREYCLPPKHPSVREAIHLGF